MIRFRVRTLRRSALLLALTAACSSESGTSTTVCQPPRLTGHLPPELAEASGIAASTQAHLAWALADGGPALVFAIDTTGRIRGRVRINGAEKYDWESLAAARCADRVCLYIGDIGDNSRSRETVRVYRIREPAAADKEAQAEQFVFRYPDGAHDAEALFVLPDEQLYVVTKGRSEPLSVYRYPGPLVADKIVTLELVQQLSPSFVQLPEMVTGAGATLDGQWIVLRTYASAQLYHMRGGQLQPVLPSPGIDLQPLHEYQGEGVDVTGGTILLISEKGLDESNPPVGRVSCTLTK